MSEDDLKFSGNDESKYRSYMKRLYAKYPPRTVVRIASVEQNSKTCEVSFVPLSLTDTDLSPKKFKEIVNKELFPTILIGSGLTWAKKEHIVEIVHPAPEPKVIAEVGDTIFNSFWGEGIVLENYLNLLYLVKFEQKNRAWLTDLSISSTKPALPKLPTSTQTIS